jgi:copper chaperone NosL
MLISDERYGTELISSKGKIFKFDSIECLTAYYIKLEDKSENNVVVTDFDRPSDFLSVERVVFVQSSRLRSPMGLYLSSHSDEKGAENLIEMFGGKILDWEAVQNLVKEKWLEKGDRKMMLQH